MTVNAHPEFLAAEKEYLLAYTKEEKLKALEKMISYVPKHKGGENVRAQLKTRYKKLKQEIEKAKKSKAGKSSKSGIKKEEMQAVIVGFTNSGKSSLISLLTNTCPKISAYSFTTKTPVVGMIPFSGINIQIIEVPALESEYADRGIVNSADTLIVVVTSLDELKKINPYLEKSIGKRIIAFNKTDLLSENEKRKLHSTLQSKKHNFVLISSKTQDGLEELKEKVFKSFGKIRVFLKEPGERKTDKPIILNPDSSIKDVAEKIFHGFSDKVKETQIWGPSSKFPAQRVGLNHKLKDMDVVEFKTR
ncbi:MAG: 50S ribosome-binding GTPase [Nanoarchaeota archaeon]|nr:50S ribosome-binding GTPase [Nanoarchaeota archaeon]